MARGGGGGIERWGDADWEKEGFAFSAQQWIIGLQGGGTSLGLCGYVPYHGHPPSAHAPTLSVNTINTILWGTTMM